MNLKRPCVTTAALALVTIAGLAAAQPLPHGSLNQSERGVGFDDHSRTKLVAAPRACTDGLCLEVTLALADPDDPTQCGTEAALEVTIGDAVNICYRMTNHTATTLNYHTLTDSIVGALFVEQMQAVAPHQTHQHNRVIIASTNPNATQDQFTSTWTATDTATEYVHQLDSEPFIDISASGTPLKISDDGSIPITTSFPVNIYGNPIDDLCIGNNGGIYVVLTGCPGFPYSNNELPATNLSAPAILPYWDDLIETGMVYYDTVGTAPDRKFVVSWHDKANYGSNGVVGGQHGVTFQVAFNEADGSLHYNYLTTTFGGELPPAQYDHGAAATVGIQRDHSVASQFSHNTPSLSDGMSIHWTLVPQQSFSVSADAQLDVGAPFIMLSPNPADGLQVSVEIGADTSEPLIIANFGDRPLHWRLTPPDSRSHFPSGDRSPVARLHAALEQTAPIPSPNRNHSQLGGGPVPAFALRNSAPPLSYVSFNVLDATVPKQISSGQVFMFAADFVANDLTRQYAVTGFDGNPRLYQVDTATGDATLIGSVGIASSQHPYGAAWDPIGSVFYITAIDFGASASFLYTVDLTTAQLSLVGLIPNSRIAEIAIDASGLMYGVDTLSAQLFAIDRSTADAQIIGPLGVSLNFSQGLDFDDATGVLYLMAFTGGGPAAYTVDTVSGSATWIGPSFGEVGGFSIATTGATCDDSDTAPWLSYDIGAGTVEPDPNATSQVSLQFDGTDLIKGVHHANLCVYSNDPTQPRVLLPIELTVTEVDDTLFRNGFEID